LVFIHTANKIVREILRWGRTVEAVRKIFEKIDDVTIYIPTFENVSPTPLSAISKN
jgi:hypothetical protein